LSSVSEEIAHLTGSKKVVKCFNTVGFNVMANPNFNGQKASMLYCGDDEVAKDIVDKLAADIGFGPVDAGPLIQAKELENLAWLWISMAIKYGHGRNMAFILNKR
jgi:predicted dinucleotide-binding enzyme